jgi:hypothetical protein
MQNKGQILKQYHIDFIINAQTLRYWAHLSLSQRAVMFHRQFPEAKISATTLHRLYKKHGIKYKYIRRIKRVIDFRNMFYKNMLISINTQFQ